MVTKEQIEEAFSGRNFGGKEMSEEGRSSLLVKAILDKSFGYSTGRTMAHIMLSLGITKVLYGIPIKKARRWAYLMIRDKI